MDSSNARISGVLCTPYNIQKGSTELPAANKICCPPGCSDTNFVMSYTPFLYVTQMPVSL